MRPCDAQSVVRKFNSDGPMVPERHCCIPSLSRIDLGAILELIGDMKCFLLDAPQQSGKTSTLRVLAERLNAGVDHRCVYVDFLGAHSLDDEDGKVTRHVRE